MPGMGDLRKFESTQKKGGSWLMDRYRPASRQFNTRAPTGPSRDRDRGGGGRRVGMGDLRKYEGEQARKRPGLFSQAMDFLTRSQLAKSQAAVPVAQQATERLKATDWKALPALTGQVAAGALFNQGIGPAPVLGQAASAALPASSYYAPAGLPTPAQSVYEYQPPSPEQALLRGEFYAPDIPITQPVIDEETGRATGEFEPVIDPETGLPAVISAPDAGPRTLPDTYIGQLRRWRQQMAAFMGAGPRTLPDTWLGQQQRLMEQYYAGLKPTNDWWGGGGGGGWYPYPYYGGGGGGESEYPWWLGLVNWRIQ